MPKFKYNAGDSIGPYNITMIERTVKVGHRWKGLFICPFCKKTFEALIANISTGNQKSCGCQRSEHGIKNLTNQKFGKLTVLRLAKEKTKNRASWFCRCDCGRCIVVRSDRLQNGNTKSCGCLERSNGEQEIKNLLDKNNICYREQYRFFDCRDKNPLPFDFAILDNQEKVIRLIEFDGEQHFQERQGWTDLQDIQRKDNIKTQYCKDNNILLVRLSYHQRGNLSLDDLLGDGYLV